MKTRLTAAFLMLMVCMTVVGKKQVKTPELWPDGTPIAAWFADTTRVDVSTLGKRYVVTDYGVKNYSEQVQTKELQAVPRRVVA